jgi:hypothetical protein
MSVKQFVTQLSTLLAGCALLPTGSFAQLSFQPSQISIPPAYTVVAHGDFNNDGREDLVVTSQTSGGPIDQLYLSKGDGTYEAPKALPALVQAIGDFNHDGKLDFATIGPSGNAITAYLGNGDGTFQAPKATTIPNEGFVSLTPVDLNHDSKTDLVELYLGAGGGPPVTLQLWISNGNGTFSKGQTIVASTGTLANQTSNSVVTGDFDGDGKPDIALVYGYVYDSATAHDNPVPTTVQVWYGDGAGHLGSPSLTSDPNKYSDSQTIAGDINNDGRSDLLSVAAPIGGSGQGIPVLAAFTGNSNRTLGYNTIATSECTGLVGEGMTIADFNGDGLNDIAYTEVPCNQSNYITELAIKLGKGAGKFGAEQAVYQNLYQTGRPFAIKSTTGTEPDIVFSQYNGGSSGSIELLTNESTGTFPGCPINFAEGVDVCQPGSVASPPVGFHVAAAGPTPMRMVAVWADGKKVAEQLTHAFSNYSFLDASVPLAYGNHAITVFGTGWDGTLQKKSFTLSVLSDQYCPPPTSPGVHICQPASGATVSSPVVVTAMATMTGTAGSMELWVDGVKRYTEPHTNALNTTVVLSAGTHRFAVLATNTAGQKWESVSNAPVK